LKNHQFTDTGTTEFWYSICVSVIRCVTQSLLLHFYSVAQHSSSTHTSL
jgi:hypothetical protein